MYIKKEDYENTAFLIIKKFIEGMKKIKESRKTPANFDMAKAISNGLPDKYLDENTSPGSYWTKWNEKKLRKYIQCEITNRLVKGL